MKVIKLDTDFLTCEPMIFVNPQDVIEEIKLILEDYKDYENGSLLSITIDEITEEEFENLPEFQGY